MKNRKKCIAALLAVLLTFCLSACTIPTPGFAEYDVSGYIQALLDSSYHAENEDLMRIAGISYEEAAQYNTTTVENAAVLFCNAYEISPSREQLQVLKAVMERAYALTKYTVKDERRTDTGYYLEVEVAPILNFVGRKAEIDALREEARQEAAAANAPKPTPTPTPKEEDEDDDDDWDEDEEEEEESAPAPSPTPAPPVVAELIDANELFVNKVLEFCKREVANVLYDQETRSIALDVRQTDGGELQLDLRQIETIDRTVVRLS